jgi:alcohol dehydrogenase
MSDYGIIKDEFPTLAKNAYETMGGLFEGDPATVSLKDCIAIYETSYR